MPSRIKTYTCEMCGETKTHYDFWHREARSGGIKRLKPWSRCKDCVELGKYDKNGEVRKPAAHAPKPKKRKYTSGECPLCGKTNRRLDPENVYAFVCNTGPCNREYWDAFVDGWYRLSTVHYPFCRGCGSQFAARIPEQQFCSRECGHMPEDYSRQLRLLATQASPVVRREEVFERDNYTCYLCSQEITDRKGPDGPSIDHVVPIVRGGTHTLDNIRTAHLRCNLAKGSRQSLGA